jgi:hypothetical protein
MDVLVNAAVQVVLHDRPMIFKYPAGNPVAREELRAQLENATSFGDLTIPAFDGHEVTETPSSKLYDAAAAFLIRQFKGE